PAGLPVCVVEAARNGGFAYGNNLGVREGWARWGRARHILLLNPDTLVRPGALDMLVSFLETHARCGIAGAALIDASERPQRAAHEMITPARELARGSGLGVFWRLLGM